VDNARDKDDRETATGNREPGHGERVPDLDCPDCGEPLVHVSTEISSGAFRTQAASMPQIPIHYYDCPECRTCWKFGTRLLPDPVRQIVSGVP
jgi:predicted RNA-binding Zn-ribbon protein involved in translation (DUF1610 family)